MTTLLLVLNFYLLAASAFAALILAAAKVKVWREDRRAAREDAAWFATLDRWRAEL